jgi:prepilin-type N-terminal cleavage/methylation domain-containing protein
MRAAKGFTLVEVVVVMALLAILSGLAVVNLIGNQREVVADASASTLIADLRTQQMKAMMGDDSGGATAQSYGILFETNSYTLFAGSSYSASDPNNFEVQIDGLTIDSTLPADTVIFNKASGEVSGFTAGQNTVTFTNSGGDTTILDINRYGVVNVL